MVLQEKLGKSWAPRAMSYKFLTLKVPIDLMFLGIEVEFWFM